MKAGQKVACSVGTRADRMDAKWVDHLVAPSVEK